MCGIAGYIGDNADFGRQFAARANRCLAHRGPDDEGLHCADGVALAHRRLAIVDLTAAGHQPMFSPDGRWALVYNGEVYNHEELRRQLSRAWEFTSRADTETVLAALALRGPAALQDMVGMWALLLWDAREKRLLAARDRYGQKPLYWRATPQGLLLASEIRPLWAENEQPAPYPPALAEYLATGNYGHLGTRTFFRDVHSFPPGHWAWCDATTRAPQPQRYWRFPLVPQADRRPYDETARRQFRDAFDAAVTSQLMSDVPVGATLSGGLDSSAVVGAIAARQRNLIIFTAQADGDKFDETPYVRAVAAKWPGRLDIHWTPLQEQTIADTLPEMIRTQEEPFGDPSIVAHGMLMKAARAAGVPVILGGQGGDELLFGYPYMAHALLAAEWRAGRRHWASREMRALGMPAAARLRTLLAGFLPGVEQRARQRSRQQRRNWLAPALRMAQHEGGPPWATSGDANAVWRETIERVALPHLTHYDDRSGMHHSIEGRMPFLDHRLADVVASLRGDAFINAGRSKWLLREACGDLLPDAVLQRRDKIGFFTPLRKMLQAESPWVRNLIGDDYARALQWYEVDTAVSYLDNLGPSGDNMRLIWRALSVRVWAETFRVRTESEPLSGEPLH